MTINIRVWKSFYLCSVRRQEGFSHLRACTQRIVVIVLDVLVCVGIDGATISATVRDGIKVL